jgi:universal stress protein A
MWRSPTSWLIFNEEKHIMPAYSHILLAVDFSASTDAVVEQAVLLRDTMGARLSLVHVVEYLQVDLSNELVLPQELELDQELVELSRRKLKDLADRLQLHDCDRHVSQGNTRREILALAEREKVDLVVIGSHGRHGMQLLLGSTANAVLHGAPCDVLAVRVKE